MKYSVAFLNRTIEELSILGQGIRKLMHKGRHTRVYAFMPLDVERFYME